MKILVVAIGHKMPKWVDLAYQDYVKRLPADYRFEFKELKPEPRTQGKTAEQMMQAEAKRIEAAVPTDYNYIVLDENGKDLSTQEFAEQISKWHLAQVNIALIIGGPDGIASYLKQRASLLIRLSSLTLPHPMVRILLIEQIYRAWSILNNHPYHRT